MIPEKSKIKKVECIECDFVGLEIDVIRVQWFPEDDYPTNREYNDICPNCGMTSIVDSDK